MTKYEEYTRFQVLSPIKLFVADKALFYVQFHYSSRELVSVETTCRLPIQGRVWKVFSCLDRQQQRLVRRTKVIVATILACMLVLLNHAPIYAIFILGLILEVSGKITYS